MTHPVHNTFIDFRNPPAPRRASCPPEFFVEAAIARAIKREKVKAKKRAGKLVKIAKKWEFVVEAAWKREETRVIDEIQALAPRIESSTPKLRCSMNLAVSPQFVRRVFPDLAHALFLETMGVIRRVGPSVQFWAADKVCDENEAMRDIVAEAKRMESYGSGVSRRMHPNFPGWPHAARFSLAKKPDSRGPPEDLRASLCNSPV